VSGRAPRQAEHFAALDETQQRALDARLAAAEEARWQGFYADRTRPRPFFVETPDENLVDWRQRGLLAPPGRALDVGCGNGRNAVWLAAQGFDVHGVDLSAQALEWAGELARRRGVALALQQASVFEPAPAAASLDLAYDSGCFHHLAPHRRAAYVALLARALRPGGLLGLVCFGPGAGCGWDDDEVYRRGSLGGGLDYTEAELHAFWGRDFEIVELRPMRAMSAGDERFGIDGLWAMLALRR
jgi:SAM-dependent methyltransferase